MVLCSAHHLCHVTSPWSAQCSRKAGDSGEGNHTGHTRFQFAKGKIVRWPIADERGSKRQTERQRERNPSTLCASALWRGCIHPSPLQCVRSCLFTTSSPPTGCNHQLPDCGQSAENAILQRRDAGDETLTDVGQQTSRGDAASRAAIGASVQKNKCDAPWRVRMPPLGHWRPYLAVCVPPPTRMHPSEIHGLTLIKSSLKY
jgi:hypothetical protein